MLLASFLKRLISIGSLRVVDACGRSHDFRGHIEGPSVIVRLNDKRLHWQLLVNPDLFLGEGYMNGTVIVEDGDIYDLLELLGRNIKNMREPIFGVFSFWGKIHSLFRQHNPICRSYRNVAHHYNLSREFFELFLDRDMQYSCAYFPAGDEDLELAQDFKKRLIADKLLVEPGHTVLDIGSGWGGMGIHLASERGADVTGITLSEEQLRHSMKRVRELNLNSKLRFELRDYREQRGQFDRIVSVGMFEHVGSRHHRKFFRCLRNLMCDSGIALLHTIGRMEPPAPSNQWILKRISPGGYIPALSEMTTAIEKENLWITDIESLRLHYAETLSHWKKRFQIARPKVQRIFDEPFCRMWEFYLALSEVSFRHFNNTVFQIQLCKEMDAVPLTRDYLLKPDTKTNKL